jgi:hypothetical protein
MNSVLADRTPQTIMIVASQRRAPTRARIRLLGTPNNTYPSENTPAPSPKIVSLKPRSSSSWSLAKLTLTRSR